MHKARNRIPAIDVAKGIGILCIVLGHVLPNSFVYSVLYAFHVPLFFVLAGLTYHPWADRRSFLLDKVRRLLIPYAAVSLFSIFLYRVAAHLLSVPAGQARLWPNLLGMLYGNTNTGWMAWNRPLWFLPCLFAVLVLTDLCETWLRRQQLRHPQFVRGGIVIVALAFGTLLNSIPGLNLPFQLESAVLLCAFTVSGVMLRESARCHRLADQLLAQSPNRLLAWLLPPALLALLMSRLNGHIDIRAHMLGNSFVLMFLAACGFIAVVLAVSYRLSHCKLLLRLGQSSMSILLLHKFPILLCQMVLPFTARLLSAWDTLSGFLCGIAVVALTLWLCLLAEKVLLRLCPWLLGRRQSR